MRAWAAALVVLATVVATEVLAHAVHRYLMHGRGWGWHRSHHEPRTGRFERNDLYAVAFAALAVGLMAWGGAGRRAPYWIGVGMTVYGVLYFIVHDWMTHQRWPWRRLPRSGYLKRLVQAHRLHHAVAGREGGVSFGFLYAPPVRVLKAQLAAQGAIGRPAGRPRSATSLQPTSPHPVSPHPMSLHPTSPHPTSLHSMSPHPTSPHPTSARPTPPHPTPSRPQPTRLQQDGAPQPSSAEPSLQEPLP